MITTMSVPCIRNTRFYLDSESRVLKGLETPERVVNIPFAVSTYVNHHTFRITYISSTYSNHYPPKTSNLPSVFMFAECIPSGTQRTSFLSSAALKTLSKKNTRQTGGLPSVKKNTRQIGGLPSVFFFALGKEVKYFFWERKRRKKNLKKTLSSAQI